MYRLFFILMWFVPESQGGSHKIWKTGTKSWKILARIGGDDYAQSEFSLEFEKTCNETSEKPVLNFLQQPGISKLLILGIVLAVFQQWCEINVIFNYAQENITNAGYSVSDILFNIVITGCVNLEISHFISVTVDKLGRKALMLVGAGGLAGIYAVLGTMYFFHMQGLPLLIMVVTAIACYAMSLVLIIFGLFFPRFSRTHAETEWQLLHFSCGQPVLFLPILSRY